MTATLKADVTLVAILTDLAQWQGKTYICPGQDKLLSLYRTRTGRTMCRRTLNRHLAGLEAQGFFQRQRRHRPQPGIGYAFRSTMYKLTHKAFQLWGRIARAVRVAGPKVPCVNTGTISSLRESIMDPTPPKPGGDGVCKEAAINNIAALRAMLGRKRP